MRRLGIAVLLVAGVLALRPVFDAWAQSPPTGPSGRTYVVVYKGSAGSVSPDRRTAAFERRYGFQSDLRYRHAIDGFAARLTSRQADELRSRAAVASVTPDRPARIAARVPLSAGETVPTGVSRISAATPAGVHQPATGAVVVIDTGIDLGHPDLNAGAGVNCVGAGPPQDDHGHGTHMAGIIGARNNGAGIVGVAPGTRLYAVKSLGSNGAASVSDVICGIDWVTANAAALGIRTANVSIVTVGGQSDCAGDPLHLAICNSSAAGVTYVAAAGNEGRDIGALPNRALPAAFPEVLTVTAMSDSDGAPGGAGGSPSCAPAQADDSYATFSNFATTTTDAGHLIAAPGVCVASTALGGGDTTSLGTSPAAAHVSGAVALCMGQAGAPGPCSGLSPAEVIQHVRTDAAANATLANGFNGDPRRPVGRGFGDLVSAFDPTVNRFPRVGNVASAPAPAAADSHVQIELLRARRIRGRRLLVVVRLAEAGTVEARATARVRRARRSGAARRLRFRTARATATPHRAVRLRLRLSRHDSRVAARRLRANRRLRATVTVRLNDQAGNQTVRRRRLDVGR